MGRSKLVIFGCIVQASVVLSATTSGPGSPKLTNIGEEPALIAESQQDEMTSACAAPTLVQTARLSLVQSWQLGQSDKDAILERHNTYRCMHGAQALTWDDGMADDAQYYADTYGFQHSGAHSYGENLAKGGHGVDMVDLWYNEIKDYYNDDDDDDDDDRGFSMETGHFTQVVWAATTHIGCAYSSSHYTLNCLYWRPGNYQGQFRTQVARAKKTWGQCAASCTFPTNYGGKSMLGCTTEGHEQAWCYTSGSDWRPCRAGDNACEFPFEYGSSTYSSCTKADSDQEWCYKVGGGWKYC